MDPRIELSLINKHIRQHNRDVGEAVMWFEFLPLGIDPDDGSTFDDVYDEGNPGDGGRRYARGVLVPTIYVEEVEDLFTAQDDARQPTQNIRVTILYLDMERAGVTNPDEFNKHLNDMFFYDNRYYKVNDYHVRGRLPTEVVIGIQGYEVFVDQEFPFDPGPGALVIQDLPWPSTFPHASV